MMDAPVLVDVEPASTEKPPAEPSTTAAFDDSGKAQRARIARTLVGLVLTWIPLSRRWTE
jgi:hypothetical protein